MSFKRPFSLSLLLSHLHSLERTKERAQRTMQYSLAMRNIKGPTYSRVAQVSQQAAGGLLLLLLG